MMDMFSEETLIFALIWVHAALLAIPLLVLLGEIEWTEWKEHHPGKWVTAQKTKFVKR